MNKLWLILVFLVFTRPDDTRIWINPDQVVAVFSPSSGYCDRGANAVIEMSSGGHGYCVQESPDFIAWKLQQAKN